jgi:hypothetical protein
MSWPKNVEQWRQYVSWESKDIPNDLVMSIIEHESGGQAGIKSHAGTKAAEILNDAGDLVAVSNALGLMQVIPPHVAAWNLNKIPKITLEDMTGDDERAARLQIKIGSSIFASYLHKLHSFDPQEFPGKTPGTATPQQLSLALVAYAIGPGKKGGKRGLIPKLERLRELKRPLTLSALEATFPKWGYSDTLQRWINRPVEAAKNVWSRYKKNIGTAPEKEQKKKTILPSPEKWDGKIMFALLIGALLFVERKWLEDLFKKT